MRNCLLAYSAAAAATNLFKIPLDALQPQRPRPLVLEVLVDRRRVVPVHIDLGQHGKGDAVVALAEGLDVVVRARLLAAEAVAWEADNIEAQVVVLLVELLQALVLRGEAALGRNIHDQHHLALKLLEREGRIGLVEGGKVVEGGVCGHGGEAEAGT